MNQSKLKARNATTAAPSSAREIASEFARIAKLKKEGSQSLAWEAANNLYSKHPSDATANFIIALILVENNQKADAIEYAEAAVKFAPDNVRHLVFLGKLYVDLDMIEYAASTLNRAFAISKTVFQAPLALAVYFLKSGQGDRALPYFDLALQAAPASFKVDIQVQRADCLRAVGRGEEAENDYRLLLDVPRYRVHALTEAALIRRNDQASEYAEKIRSILVETDLSSKDRSSLLLCLGRLYENGQDYDNAYMNFEMSRNILSSKFKFEDFAEQIDDNLRVFKREVFESFRNFGHESDKPIFVVGMPRSGTTLTEQILASHSQAEGVGELNRMSRMAESFSRHKGMQEVLDKMSEVGPVEWKNAPQQYLNLINALAPDVRHTVDKMPHNFMNVGFIHLCFPNAKFIHCRRNPLDNFISAYQNRMSRFHGYSFDQVSYGEYYIKYLQLMDHWKSVLPNSIYESRYESLTANPEVEVRNMLDFLGLPWEDSCLKFHERASTVRTFSQLQVRAPINTGSVARWRKYEQHLGRIISVLQGAKVEF